MIFKITPATTCGKMIRYHLQKMEKGNAQLVVDKFMHSEAEPTITEELPKRVVHENYQRLFEHNAEKNKRVYKNKYLDISANFSAEDSHKLDEKTRLQIINEWMKHMKYEQNQYLIFRHTDKKHVHYHILTPTITPQGKKIQERNNYHKSASITRQIEKKYNLKQLNDLSIKEKEPQEKDYHIAGAIQKALFNRKIKPTDPLLKPLHKKQWKEMNNEQLSDCYQDSETFIQLQEVLKEYQCLKPNYKKQLEIDLLNIKKESNSFKEFQDKARSAGYYVRYIHHKKSYQYGFLNDASSRPTKNYYFKEDRLNSQLHAGNLDPYFRGMPPPIQEEISKELTKTLKTSYTLSMALHRLSKKGIKITITPPPPEEEEKRLPTLAFTSQLDASKTYKLHELTHENKHPFTWENIGILLAKNTKQLPIPTPQNAKELHQYTLITAIHQAIQHDAIDIENNILRPLITEHPKTWTSLKNKEIEAFYIQKGTKHHEALKDLVSVLKQTEYLPESPLQIHEKNDSLQRKEQEKLLNDMNETLASLRRKQEDNKQRTEAFFDTAEQKIKRAVEKTLQNPQVNTWEKYENELHKYQVYLNTPQPNIQQIPDRPLQTYTLKNFKLDPERKVTITEEDLTLTPQEIRNKLLENQKSHQPNQPPQPITDAPKPTIDNLPPHHLEWKDTIKEKVEIALHEEEIDTWEKLTNALQQEDITLTRNEPSYNEVQTILQITLPHTDTNKELKQRKINSKKINYDTQHINNILNERRLNKQQKTTYPTPSAKTKNYVLKHLDKATQDSFRLPCKEQLEKTLSEKHIQTTFFTDKEKGIQATFITRNADTEQLEKIHSSQLDYPREKLERIMHPPFIEEAMKAYKERKETEEITPTISPTQETKPATQPTIDYIKRHLKRLLRETTSITEFSKKMREKKIEVHYLTNKRETYGVTFTTTNPTTQDKEQIKGSAIEYSFKKIAWHIQENQKRRQKTGTQALHPHKKEAINKINQSIYKVLNYPDITSIQQLTKELENEKVKTTFTTIDDNITQVQFSCPNFSNYPYPLKEQELKYTLEKINYITTQRKKNYFKTLTLQKLESQYNQTKAQDNINSMRERYIKRAIRKILLNKNITTLPTLLQEIKKKGINPKISKLPDGKEKIAFQMMTPERKPQLFQDIQIGYKLNNLRFILKKNLLIKTQKEVPIKIAPYASMQKQIKALQSATTQIPKLLGLLANAMGTPHDNLIQETNQAMHEAERQAEEKRRQEEQRNIGL